MKYEENTAALQTNKQCGQVYINTSHAWRSSPVAGHTAEGDLNRMTLASSCGALFYEELMKPSPCVPVLPWEQYYLSTPIVNSVDELPWASNSNIKLITSPWKNNSFVLGSEVKFVIEVFNGRKERKTLGGDLIYVWLMGDEPKTAISADVTDHHNGTHTAVTVLPWSGNVKVMAGIAQEREKFRMMFYLQRIYKTTHWFIANFVSINVSEATPCLPFPSLPGHPSSDVCNFTEQNGSPWYCGKPVKKEFLNCSHYSSVMRLPEVCNPPLISTEKWLLETPHEKRPFLIPNIIKINVLTDELSKSNVVSLPQLKCHERNMSLTFTENNSYGFFFHGTWRPLTCQLPEMTTELVVKCLQDTKVIYVGDSNSRKQFDIMTSLVPCENKIVRTSGVWHRGLHCENSTNNISIHFYPHSFPFFGSTGEKLTNDDVVSEVKLMDSIPKDGKYIFHLHHFMHLAPFHLSLLESRLKLVREAMERLLARNPHVIIVYQSAHSVYIRQSMNGAFFVEIQRRILKGLGDRVMFMFTWPMTVAANNDDVHPPICNSFTAYYMGHICGRVNK